MGAKKTAKPRRHKGKDTDSYDWIPRVLNLDDVRLHICHLWGRMKGYEGLLGGYHANLQEQIDTINQRMDAVTRSAAASAAISKNLFDRKETK